MTGKPDDPPRSPDDAKFRAVTALRDVLATRRHADMLFDMVADQMGPAARVEASPDGNYRRLFRLGGTDPRCVIPWPLLVLSRQPRQIWHMEIAGLTPVAPPPPRPGKAPNLRDLGPGTVSVHDGVPHIDVAYADDGRWFECSRGGPPETLEALLPVLSAGGANAVETVAGFLAGLDIARHGPGRVWLPEPDRWTPDGVWGAGLAHLRRALARGAIPEEARWMAADPLDGSAVASGATRDEALFAWSAEVERARPRPAPPEARPEGAFDPPAPPELPGEGDPGNLHFGFGFSVGGPAPALPPGPPPPPPPPGTVPAAFLSLAEFPAAPPPFGRWLRLLGAAGNPVFAALREERAGWTLVGERALAVLGAPEAESGLDEADRDFEGRDRTARPGFPWRFRGYLLLDEAGAMPVPPSVHTAGSRADPAFPALDGDAIARGGARMRKARP